MSNSLRDDESPEETARANWVPKHWIGLGLLVVANAAGGAYFNPIRNGGKDVGELRMFFLMGAMLSQPILIAIWASLADQRFYRRFLWSILLCISVSLAEDLLSLWLGDYREVGLLIVADLTLFLTATVILSVFRRFCRWRIKQPGGEDRLFAYQESHFGTKHLLILATITALGGGLLWAISIINPDLMLPRSIDRFIAAMWLVFALLFPIIVIPWVTLDYRRRQPSQIFFTVIAVGLLDVAACFLMIEMNSPGSAFSSCGPIIKPVLFVELGSGMSAIVGTLGIRWCGFRMVREPRAGTRTQV